VILLAAVLLALFVLPSPWGVIVVFLGLFLELGEIAVGLHVRRRRARVGRETMIGRQAQVLQDLSPTGLVLLDGERWHARATSPAPRGSRVVITAVHGLELEVEPAPQASTR
jgi:membrane-bound ClpP family serine protease